MKDLINKFNEKLGFGFYSVEQTHIETQVKQPKEKFNNVGGANPVYYFVAFSIVVTWNGQKFSFISTAQGEKLSECYELAVLKGLNFIFETYFKDQDTTVKKPQYNGNKNGAFNGKSNGNSFGNQNKTKKEYKDDGRPWLNDKEFKELQNAIFGGADLQELKAQVKGFKMSKVMREKVKELNPQLL